VFRGKPSLQPLVEELSEVKGVTAVTLGKTYND
jgi:hypothetical protein